jgi:hypothetical protein
VARSSLTLFSELWRAYSEGRLERELDLVDPSCELVMLGSERRYVGRDGVRAWLQDVRDVWQTLTIIYDSVEETLPGCVIASGRVTASSKDGTRTIDSPLICVAWFADERLQHGRAFGDRESADRHVAELVRAQD